MECPNSTLPVNDVSAMQRECVGLMFKVPCVLVVLWSTVWVLFCWACMKGHTTAHGQCCIYILHDSTQTTGGSNAPRNIAMCQQRQRRRLRASKHLQVAISFFKLVFNIFMSKCIQDIWQTSSTHTICSGVKQLM